MPTTQTSAFMDLTVRFADALESAGGRDEALVQADRFRREIAGADGIFSVQQNVTTGTDPLGEIRLRRFYSSESERFPVSGAKRKVLSPWTQCLFVQGRTFVAEGVDALALHFDDYEQMRPYGLQSVVNVPLWRDGLCHATFNVFGTRSRWMPQEILGIRLLALACARWIPAAPGLAYHLSSAPASLSLEG